MTVKETLKMQLRSEFKQLLRFNGVKTSALDRLEESYDALAASDYARLPMYRADVQQVESLLKAFYGEGVIQ